MHDYLQAVFFELVIKQVIYETEEARTFVLERAGNEPLHYIPGQFLTFVFEKKDGEEARRNYSISSSPELSEPLQITVKRIPNGEYSRWFVDKAKVGERLKTIGASGFFVLPEDIESYRQLFFFAAGSGITPIYALIKTVLKSHPLIGVVLIYSNTSPEETIFRRQLEELQLQFHERLHIEFLFSSGKGVLHKRLGIYQLEKFLEKYGGYQIHKPLYYLCGPFEYMRMITIVLRNYGVALANIKKEIFNIEKPVLKTEPPDKDKHTVFVKTHQQEYEFECQYPQTILQTARQLKIPLPYSCESGQCGACAATCVSGKVWMWRNDVLLDEEMANGRVLTCTGYAIGGDVKLKF